MTTHRTINIGAALLTAAPALAGVAEPAIESPFALSEVTVTWGGTSAGYTGELGWVDPEISTVGATLWTNHGATAGQSFVLPRLYTLGERVDFVYEIIRGKHDVFSTAVAADWDQFRVDATDPTDVLVFVEDIRLPGGDADYNDVRFRVGFASAVPAPGAIAPLAALSLGLARRRR